MESFLETINLINFEKIDYEYTVESLIIDINKLNSLPIAEKDDKARKNEKEKLKADKKKDSNKSSNKQKQKKKKAEDKDNDMNVSKQSANMSIFVVPNVKKNPNYDLQLSQLDKLNKSKIKNVKKNDFDKIKKILSANNISMNINKASKAIQDMKTKENKNKQHHQKAEKDKEKRVNIEIDNSESQNIKRNDDNIFTSTVTNYIESEEVIDTTNPENQIKNSEVILNDDQSRNQDNKGKQSGKDLKSESNKAQKISEKQQDKEKNKNAKGGKKGEKAEKEENVQQRQQLKQISNVNTKQAEKDKNTAAQQNTQSKRVDDFIKNLKEKKLAKAKTNEPELKQFLKQSFYEKNKYLFILDPTQRLRMRDPNANLTKDVIMQFFELVNSIFSKLDFNKEEESEIEYIRQNIKEFNILADNLMEVCENKNDVALTLLTADLYLSHVRKIYAENFSAFLKPNFALVKSLMFNCLYSSLKFFANVLNESNNLKGNIDDYKKIYNTAAKILESISLNLSFFCEENEKNLNKHVSWIENNNLLGKESREDSNGNDNQAEAKYLNSFGNKDLRDYNFKGDENLNFYLLTKVILFAAIKNIGSIKKAFDSTCGNQATQDAKVADSTDKLNLNSFFLYGITNENSDFNKNQKKSESGIGKLISLFANSIKDADSKPIVIEKKDEEDNQESSERIEIETKKKLKKPKNAAAAAAGGIDYTLFSQYLSCLKFFTKLNLSFETHKNKIQNLMITVSKLIVSLLNEIKAIFLNSFANEFYLSINKLIQIYIQNFKELYEANESSYNEISDLINLAIDESINQNNTAAITPFSVQNKEFDFEKNSQKIFENFNFISLDLNYFLDDLARNYLQISIKYLKIAEKGLKFFLAKPANEGFVSAIKNESNFYVLAFLEFFNRILLCIINLKSHNLKPIYFKIITKSLEIYLPASNNDLTKPMNSVSLNSFENSEILVKYILCDIRNFIKDSFSNSTSKNILKNLKNIRETIHFYSSFASIKKQAVEFIENPYLYEEETAIANLAKTNTDYKSTLLLENSIYILMLLNFFDFNNSNNKKNNENADLKLFKEYFELQRKNGNNEICFSFISQFDKKLCLYYLNNYVDSEIKNLDIIKELLYSVKNESKRKQYELILENLRYLLFQEEEENKKEIANEKIYYQRIFNELKAFDNVLGSNINQYSSSNLSLANEHNKEITDLIALIKSFIKTLLSQLKINRINAQKEKENANINALNEKANLIESVIVYFINKKDILLQVFPDTNNLKASESKLETCGFYDEILFLITSENVSDTNTQKDFKLKYDIMHEIKVNNEKLISKALTLKQSNKLYPKKIKSKSDIFEYLIQILRLETLLKESEQAEKIKEEMNLKNKKAVEIQEDILIESEGADVIAIENQINKEISEADKINVLETLDKINNQVAVNKLTPNLNTSPTSTDNPEAKSTVNNYSDFSNNHSNLENKGASAKEETIANLDLILKLFIEYFDVITNELAKGIELKFPTKALNSSGMPQQQQQSNSAILEKALFNLINYLESITIILKNDTFFKSFVKNLDLLEIFLKKFLNIKDLCADTSKKLANSFKLMQNSDTKIFEYNLNFVSESIALSELTEKLIFIASDALKNKFKHYLIYVFGEAELYKHLLVKDLESIQSVGFEMEEFYKKSIFEQSKVNGFLKRIQDEENDYLEDVMLEIYSKEAIKYLEYPEEVIDMLSNINEAVQNDFKISAKDFYSCIFPYFYSWKTIMSKIEYGFKLFTNDKKYVGDLDNYKMLLKFNINYFERNTKLYNTFCLVVVSLLHILDEDRHLIEKKGNVINFENFDESELLTLGDKMDNRVLFEFILNVLYKFVKIFPSLVKYYYDQLQGRLKSVFRSLITNMILPKMLTHLKTKIDSNRADLLKALIFVKENRSLQCIEFEYKMNEEIKFFIEIRIPPLFPLTKLDVILKSNASLSEQKLFQTRINLIQTLNMAIDNICDNLISWSENVKLFVVGDNEPCPVCYYYLNNTDKSLPNLTCRTCKKKFHSLCMREWFNNQKRNMQKTSCPMCRSEWKL